MEDVARYLASVEKPQHPLLLELEQHARKDGVQIIPRETGRLLSVLVHAMQANRILEIGTAYGYATLWMALAQPPMGKIWTIDPDVERTEIALEYFVRASEDDYITIQNQPALELLPNFQQRNLDIIFIDAQIAEYKEYLDLVFPMLKLSGLVVIPNMLLHGVDAAPSKSDSVDVRAMREFNEYFLDYEDLDSMIVPVDGGVGIGSRIR